MNDLKKIKVLTALVALLALLNICLLGYMWFAPHGGRPSRPRDGHGPGGLMIKEFKFDDAQQKQFETLRNEHHAAMLNIEAQSRQLHNTLFQNLANTNDTSKLVDSLIAEIAKGQIEREKITYHHLQLVRQMCNPEQQKKFDEMIAKAMSDMHREEGPPPTQER